MSWNLTIDEIIQATGGSLRQRGAESIRGVGTDTRKDLSGRLFVALVGDRFDAHDFLQDAVKAGAVAVLVHRWKPEWAEALGSGVSVIEVKDTTLALQKLATYWRRKNKFKVVGVTGSNGKTSTKEFAKALLSPHRRCFASQGSLNNHWGVPISLLSADPGTEVVIQEMGMNHAGEIKFLCEIAEPDVVVVTMVGKAHIGELGSQQNIAKAKEEIYLASPKAVQIFNLDNEWTIAMYERARKVLPAGRLLTFSVHRGPVDVQLRVERISDFKLDVSGSIRGVRGRALVPVAGRQNVTNLMAAASIAVAVGVAPELIWQEMVRCRGTWGRNQLVQLQSGTPVLFDAYNANPESMGALIKNLIEMDIPGQRVMVLGEMMELGHEAAKAHRELGEMVARTGVDVVWFMGPSKADFEAGLKAEKFQKTYYISDGYEESLALKIGSVLNQQDIAVIKGSRAMKLERVLQCWSPVNFSGSQS